MIQLTPANIEGTPLKVVRFFFADITPEIAAELLRGNGLNRKLKEMTVDAYAMDMTNDAWLTPLKDGQHRLHAIVRSKKTVRLLVSTGWPAGAGKKKTMDAVDRGVQRSLPDQIHLQHGFPMKDASRVVQICNAIAAASFGLKRVRKATPASVLAVLDVYKAEIKWLMDTDTKEHGLRQATVAGCISMARALWPDKVSDFWTRLRTGENLTRTSPILHLRNWLLGAGAGSQFEQRDATFHHLREFVEGRDMGSLVCTSEKALLFVLAKLGDRTKKVCAIYNQPLPSGLRPVGEEDQEDKAPPGPLTPAAIKIGKTLVGIFTSTDLAARVDGVSGQWLLAWRSKGWIESSGTGWVKTAEFGQ